MRIAIIAAANGFNPIPGLDIAADIGLLLKLSHDLQEIYGLTPEQLDYEAKMHLKARAWIMTLKGQTVMALKTLLTREGILIRLQELAPLLEGAEFVKWIPLAGQTLAAIFGYRLVVTFAAEAINEYEKQAIEIMKSWQKPAVAV